MNFSTLKGLTIPEGNVKQIADASGRVLWSAVKPIITFNVWVDYISGPFPEQELYATFTAEEGMTWEEWFASDYNDQKISGPGYSGVFVHNDKVYFVPFTGEGTSALIYDDANLSRRTLPTDVIIASNDYWTEQFEW